MREGWSGRCFSWAVPESAVGVGGVGTYTYTEQSEPLGQQIELNDPGTGCPTDYGSQVLGFAGDPEWQCVVSNLRNDGFRDMPVHCQKAALEDKNFSIAGAFGYSVRKESPAKISGTDSPLPRIPGDGGGSPSALVLARSMRASRRYWLSAHRV